MRVEMFTIDRLREAMQSHQLTQLDSATKAPAAEASVTTPIDLIKQRTTAVRCLRQSRANAVLLPDVIFARAPKRRLATSQFAVLRSTLRSTRSSRCPSDARLHLIQVPMIGYRRLRLRSRA
jgi:hypothetical protein